MLKLSNVSSVVRETERGSKGDVGEPGPKGELGDQGAPGPAIFVDSGEEVVTVKGQKVNDAHVHVQYLSTGQLRGTGRKESAKAVS